MLTRSAVAKKLCRSLATVRRLEGTELFPWRDSRGVHWFDEADVERVAARFARADVPSARGAWLRKRCGHSQNPPINANREMSVPSDSVAGLRAENRRLRRELDDANSALADLADELEDLFR
jgi:hypothetical protein